MVRSGRLLSWIPALPYGCFQPHSDGFEGKEYNDSGIDREALAHPDPQLRPPPTCKAPVTLHERMEYRFHSSAFISTYAICI